MSFSISLFWNKWKGKKDMHSNFWEKQSLCTIANKKGNQLWALCALWANEKYVLHQPNCSLTLGWKQIAVTKSMCWKQQRHSDREMCHNLQKWQSIKQWNNETMKQWFDAKRLLRYKSYNNITILLPHCLIHWRRQEKVILEKEKRKRKRGILDANPLIRQLFYSANFHQTTFFPSSSL